MLRKTLKQTVLVRALAMAFGTAALAAGVAPTAFAQSNTSGNVFGSAPAGAVVVVENPDTGLKRRVTVDAGGNYRALSLPTGRYKVQLLRNEAVVATRDVEVLIGQGSEINFGTSGAQAVEKVQVVATRQTIDVSSTLGGATFTAKEMAALPIAQNVASVIQLAPNTTRGDARYGGANAPSFGGASASENAAYINGFPVTNVLFQVGFSQLPFGSIGQAQILSGGYGAEFGRSTGGVINITTKSGSNTWEGGVSFQYDPATLKSKPKNFYYANNGTDTVNTNGKLRLYREANRNESTIYQAYLGGPIVKDKLFFYINGEFNRGVAETLGTANVPTATNPTPTVTTTGWTSQITKVPRYLAKLDWNITDNHRVEYTRVHDDVRTYQKFYGFNYSTLQRTNVQNGGTEYQNWSNSNANAIAAGSGADLDIIKYTGYLTEDLTLSGLWGKSKVLHKVTPFNYQAGLYQINAPANAQAPGITYPSNPQGVASLLVAGAQDTQNAYRIDLEWKLGKHTLRAGVDDNLLKSKSGTETGGGGLWVYGKVANPLTDKPDPKSNTTASGGGLGTQGYFVSENHSATLSTPKVKQSAQYIEDRFQVTNNVLVTLGLRSESFTNYNGDGKAYVEQKNQIAPRLAASWDVNGDASLKVFGTLGRYHLQMPNNVAIRGAGSSLNTATYYTYTGVNPTTGAPTGLVAISPVTSANNEFGQAVDPEEVAAKNMKPHYQDEWTMGFEKAWTPNYNIGGKYTFRKLKSSIDDFCDDRPFFAWAARNGVNATGFGFRCALFNPGEDNTFTIDLNGDGKKENIFLSAKDLGYPKIKREYQALDFFLEHPLRDGWYGKINYTWSKSSGNTEGQLLSDIGQADVATTQVFDYPEIMINADGRLPNDRKHQIKIYGYKELNTEWGLGANGLAASGRPKNCIGNLSTTPAGASATGPIYPNNPYGTNDATAYGSAFFYCNNQPSPRGSMGELPWDLRLDLSANYKPSYVKGLQFKATVFNVFNRQVVTAIEERRHARGSTVIQSIYQVPLAMTAPRSFLFMVQYDFKP